MHTYILTGDQSSSKGRVCHDRDTELSGSLEEGDLVGFDIEDQGRVFDLESRDGMDRVGAAQIVRGAFG